MKESDLFKPGTLVKVDPNRFEDDWDYDFLVLWNNDPRTTDPRILSGSRFYFGQVGMVVECEFDPEHDDWVLRILVDDQTMYLLTPTLDDLKLVEVPNETR